MVTDSYILNRDLSDLRGEVWSYIPGYATRYQVSNFGRVKSFVRDRPIILKKTLSNGRFKVLLYKKPGKYVVELVGRLVGRCFISEPGPDQVLKYLDKNILNDKADNLKWMSYTESIRRTFQDKGGINTGQKNGMAKLDEIKVKEIRDLRAAGKTYSSIAQQYKVSISCVQFVVQKKIWKAA